MEFMISATTDIGLTKNINQDSFSVRQFRSNYGNVVLAVLCDGMGGLAKGEVASATLIRAFEKWSEHQLPQLLRNGLEEQALQRDWNQIITENNEKIKNYGKQTGINLGTTVTALLITGTRYHILNVGDTRAYEIADHIQVLTQDQTVVAQEIACGRLTPEEAERDPRRSVLLQCVGASETVQPDYFSGIPRQNAVYMLCSDGFRHQISPEEIYQYLNPACMTDSECMKKNMEALIELDKQRQERDNITVVSIRTY